MRDLYPKIKPYATHSIDVGAGHVLYVEESGEPDGIPVLFVHGGPGAGCSPYHRCFFDPEKYRIILFDQRGSGHSSPHASLLENTTPNLVADMEKIREKLGIKKWLLFGGSWGSTLSLVYAETHPDRVLGLILRGIFLCRPHEIKWFYQEGASHMFPDYWESYLKPIPEDERDDMVAAYYKRLTSKNELERMAVAKAWSKWEGRTSTLHPSKKIVDQFSEPHNALSLARIECHYFTHDSFLEPNQILRDADRLGDIPGIIVQGRYDVVCPMQSAWDLYQVWPKVEMQIIPDAGHSALETGIIDALVRATDGFAQRLS
jgi:proline iminopeptidase